MSMICAISGQPPSDPVVSRKTGHVFEKRLIVEYLQANNNKCPVTDQPLTEEDLVPLKVGQVSKPRPTTASSVPGMLSLFQAEWDSVMLESFTLKKQLETARQELAHALYQHDAACRVIARLTKERDDALKALANVHLQQQQQHQPAAPAVATGGEMEVDNAVAALSEEIIRKMRDKSIELSSQRKKRQISPTVASAEAVQGYTLRQTLPTVAHFPKGVTAVDLRTHAAKQQDASLVVTGGADGKICIFDRLANAHVTTLQGHSGLVSQVVLHPTENAVFSSSYDHTARIWKSAPEGFNAAHTLTVHGDKVVGCSLHCTQDYLATASADNSWAMHDVNSGACVMHVKPKQPMPFSSISFHPDGLILGTGTADNVVRIWEVQSHSNVATFEGHSGPVRSLSFSENGYYLATGSEDGTCKIWDLRKLKDLHTTQASGAVQSVSFDHSGLFLAVSSGPSAEIVHGKTFQTVAKFSINTPDAAATVTGALFGPDAAFVLLGSSSAVSLWC